MSHSLPPWAKSNCKEQLPLCARFVDKSGQEFLTFIALKRVTVEAIFTDITKKLKCHLDFTNLRRQTYAGTSIMSSVTVGVHAGIKMPQLLWLYTFTHCPITLNLVVARSFGQSAMHNIMTQLKSVCLFFNNNDKRNGLLSDLIKHRLDSNNSKRRPLLNLCKTRWVERVHAFRHFYHAYTCIVEALEAMVYHSDLDVCNFWEPTKHNKTEMPEINHII